MVKRLTQRQREIVELLCQGYNVGGVANNLGISHYTVRRHLACLYEKLGVKSQVQLVVLYLNCRSRTEEGIHDSRDCQSILSQREQEVWSLYQQGLIPKQIGEELCISASTAREYLRRVRQKLDNV